MLARLFVFIGGLIVLALTAALVGPYFIDWTSYRSDFEREASAILGRKVTVEGRATARLLPFPSVTFSDVSVGGAGDREPAMTVDEFSMDAELAPFLRGEFLIFDMRLVRPRAIIDVAADGTVDWAIRPSTPYDPRRIALERLTVSEGQVTIRHVAGGREHLLSGIDAEISAKSLAGPWRANGVLQVDGMKAALSASTGPVDDAGQMRLRFRFEPELYPVTIEADGNARIEKGAALYSGQFKITGEEGKTEKLRDGDGELVEMGSSKPEPGYRLNGEFAFNHERLGIEEFRFETGSQDNPYTADGAAFVDLGSEPRFSIEAKGAQVRFDEAVTGEETGVGLTLAGRVTALRNALARLPKPTIPGNIEVNLPAVVAGDTTVRDVRLLAEPADSGWVIESLAATLPGRTRLEADGFLRTDQEFGFTGSLLLAVGQPSGFAAWVSTDVDEAIRRLPAAGFKASVEMTENRQTFRDLELVLGAAKFTGEIDSRQPEGVRPSVFLVLDGEALDVEGLAAFASLFVSDKGANRFADRDLDFRIKAGPVTAGGLTADTVDTALRLRNGALEIDRLSIGGLAGASLSATGSVKDFPHNPAGNLDASIVAVDLAPLVRLAAERFPENVPLRELNARATAYPGLLEDTRIDLVANDSKPSGVALSVKGVAGGSTISATLTTQGGFEAPLSLSFLARNDDATALMALAGLPALPLGVTGPGDLAVSAKGAFASGMETAFSLSGQEFDLKFSGIGKFTGQGPSAKGAASVEAADIEPWLMTLGVGLPGMGMGTQVALSADADFADGRLALANLDGTVNEGAVAGSVEAETRNGAPHLSGELKLDEIELSPAIAMVLGESAIAPANGRWPSVPFQPKASAPVDADLKVSAGTVSVGAIATAYDATFNLGLGMEGLRLSDVTARLYGGELSGLFELRNNDGTGLFSAQMKIHDADIAEAVAYTGLTGNGDLSTALTASGKSIGGLVAALSGSGTAALRNLVVPGVNANALEALIGKADVLGRDIDARKTASFAPEIVTAGTFPAGNAELAFTVAGGVLRAPPIDFDIPAATISTDFRADLTAGTIAAEGSITYAAGEEALVGSEPSVRFSLSGPPSNTSRSLDSQPLAQFLTQRALEREQARVEAMQAAVLEKQRLRREARYYAALQEERNRAAEALRLQQAEEARLKAEAEAREKAEAEARIEAENEARRAAEEAARAAEAEKARRQAEETPRPKVEDVRPESMTPALPPETGRKLDPWSIDGFLRSLEEDR